MKRIRALDSPPAGLASYLATVDHPDWVEFRSHETGASYRELIEALAVRQHGLCAYCEIDLLGNDRQIEHFVPRSGTAERDLDVGNLVAACRGGSSTSFAPDGPRPDEVRFLPPARRNISCGQAKGNRSPVWLIDPRDLPTAPVFKVLEDGRLEADAAACASSGVSLEDLAKTIEALGLNVRRLREARRQFTEALIELAAAIGDDDMKRRWIRALLSPNAEGNLRRFFTTSRSYFGALAERVLETTFETWV